MGTFVVQIAKAFGADQVIDYTREDFARRGQHYDLILGIAGNCSVSDYMRALRPKGTHVPCVISPVALLLGALISMFSSKKVVQSSHSPDVKDLAVMKELLEAGKVVPAIDRRFPFNEVAGAVRYYGEGHSRGKVVITV